MDVVDIYLHVVLIHACCAYVILWQSNQVRSNIEVDSACMWHAEMHAGVIIFDWYQVCAQLMHPPS